MVHEQTDTHQPQGYRPHHEVRNLSYNPEPSDEYVLEQSHFEGEWKIVHDDIFVHPKGETRKPYWLPNQLFGPDYLFSFIIGNYHLHEEPFEKLSRGLRYIGEREFIVVGAEKQFDLRSEEQQDRKLVYPVDITWEQYTQGREKTTFFLLVQPTEFFLHGKRRDWGIVGSNDFGIAILGSRNEAREAFRGMFIEDPEVLREQYLSQAPPDYGTRFSENYLT